MTKFLKANFALFIIFAAILSSCNEKESILGTDVIDDPSVLQIIDSLELVAYTENALPLRQSSTATLLLGDVSDPVFGRTTSVFATQFTFQKKIANFGNNPVCDSIILQFRSSKFTGDSLSKFNIMVKRLSQTIKYDSTYYSNFDVSSITLDENYALSESYSLTEKDSIIRIPLSTELAQYIFTNDSTILQTDTLFRKFFNGLAIIPEQISGNGGISSITSSHTDTKMILYYKNDTADSLNYAMSIGSFCQRYNLFNHNYSTSEFNTIIGDSINKNSQVLIKSLAGLNMVVDLVGLKNWNVNKDTISILKAELFLPVDEINQNRTGFSKPTELAALYYANDKTFSEVLDYNIGSLYLNSKYNETEKSYIINLTKHVQAIVKGSINSSKISLVPISSALIPSGVIFNQNEKLKLKLYYSKLK